MVLKRDRDRDRDRGLENRTRIPPKKEAAAYQETDPSERGRVYKTRNRDQPRGFPIHERKKPPRIICCLGGTSDVGLNIDRSGSLGAV